MIIDHVYHPYLTPHIEPYHADYKNQVIRTPNTYGIVSQYSDYCNQNDVILYDVGFISDFLKTPLSTILSNDQIQSIKNKQVLLAVDLSLEVNFNQVDAVYENLVLREGLPADQILLIASSLDYVDRIKEISKMYDLPHIKYEYYGYWARVQQRTFIETLSDLGYTDFHRYNSGIYGETTKKFLCFNNAWKEHRIALLCLLESYNLIDQAFYSFNNKPLRGLLHDMLLKNNIEVPDRILQEQQNTPNENWNLWLNDTLVTFYSIKDEILSGRNVINKLPLILDNSEFNTGMAYFPQTYILKYYKNTYFSVVTETGFQSNVATFLTEKIFKPIAHKHPFVYCSYPYSLQKLRALGYKTYDSIIDESYDNELNDSKRMLMVAREIKRLCSLSGTELKEFKIKAQLIAEYNFNLFINEQSFIKKIL